MSHPLTPFRERKPPEPRPAWKRWLRIGEPAKAAAQLESLLAKNAPDVPAINAVSEALAGFGIKGRSARKVLNETFGRALAHSASDHHVDSVETAYLQRLRGVLGVSDRELDSLYEQIVEPIYAKAVSNVLDDRRITAEEKQQLQRIVDGLRLSPQAAEKVFSATGQQLLAVTLKRVTQDQRLSPEEDAELHELVRALGVADAGGALRHEGLDRMRLLWRIENGDLPTINPPIALQRGEVCHASMPVDWYEPRTRMQTVGYHGATASIKILPGVRYRVGSIKPIRFQVDEMVHADSGTLYLTNKRLIFDGHRKNTTMRLSSLLGFVPYTNGVSIEKSSGRPPTAQFSDGDAELFHVMLSAALASQ